MWPRRSGARRAWLRTGSSIFCFFHSTLWPRNNSRISSQVPGRQRFAFFHRAPAKPAQHASPGRRIDPKSKRRKGFVFSSRSHRIFAASHGRVTTSVCSGGVRLGPAGDGTGGNRGHREPRTHRTSPLSPSSPSPPFPPVPIRTPLRLLLCYLCSLLFLFPSVIPLLLRCLRSLLFPFHYQTKKGPPPGSDFPRGGPFLILRPLEPKLCRYPASRHQVQSSKSPVEVQPQE